MGSRFHGLLYQEVREKGFHKFDLDKNGSLCKNEFDRFLHTLDREYLKYLLRAELVSFRAYWGRGLVFPSVDRDNDQDANRRFSLLSCGCTRTKHNTGNGQLGSDELAMVKALACFDKNTTASSAG